MTKQAGVARVSLTSVAIITPSRTALPFWRQNTYNLTGLSPKQDCSSNSPKRVVVGAPQDYVVKKSYVVKKKKNECKATIYVTTSDSQHTTRDMAMILAGMVGLGPGPVSTASSTAVLAVLLYWLREVPGLYQYLNFYVRPTITPHDVVENHQNSRRRGKREREKEGGGGVRTMDEAPSAPDGLGSVDPDGAPRAQSLVESSPATSAAAAAAAAAAADVEVGLVHNQENISRSGRSRHGVRRSTHRSINPQETCCRTTLTRRLEAFFSFGAFAGEI